MKIKLNCLNKAGTPEIWLYDNVSNELWDGEGKLVDLTQDKRLMSLFPDKNTGESKCSYASSKSRKLRALKIQLGLKCNMHCKYCAQSDRASEKWCSSPKDVKPFIERLKNNGIEVSGRIELWGGEPFVYWKTIQLLVPPLREIYPKTEIFMITNGTLLDESKIDFCEKYKVSLTFSHDGQGYHLRGKDPLDDPRMVNLWRLAFSKLRCNINCVLTPANTDIAAIKENIQSRLGKVPINFEGIMTHLGVQESELMFTESQIVSLQSSIFKEMSTGAWTNYPALAYAGKNLIARLMQRKALSENSLKCSMNRPENMAVNLRGDVLSCHDHCTEEGYVGSMDNPEKVDISKHFKSWKDRDKCRKCLVLSLCRGSCPQVEGLARTLTCKNEFAYYIAVFQSVFYELFGLTLQTCQPIED